jgi:hypothetical protein
MVSIGPLKFQNALLCEDVREEAGTSKHILIGTFSGDIRIGGTLPAVAQFALYLDILAPGGDYEFELRFSGPGAGSATLGAKLQMVATGYGTITTSRMQILLEKEGILRIDGRIAGGRWVNILKKRVFSDPSIVSQRPFEPPQPGAQESSSPPAPSRQAARGKRPRS